MTGPRLLRSESGASAAEFALVLPLLLLLLFGIFDAGRYMWQTNAAEKATQMGARMAVVTYPLDSGLASASYVGVTVGSQTLTQGDRIPAGALGTLRCTNTGCSCNTAPCPTAGTYNGTAFTTIVNRMKAFKPDIAAANVIVDYSGSGVGYAGDPNGMEIAPLVTVSLQNVDFRPITTFLFPDLSIPLPDVRTSLTAEDSVGAQSN
jgi:Flp pilus assembly protein TadG